MARIHVACWSIVLGGCSAVNGLVAHPGGGGGGGGGAQASTVTAQDTSGLSAKERWWRKVQEDSANAKGDWNNGNGDDGHMKRSHDLFAQNCGHDVQVVFDWKSFDMNHWVEVQKKEQRPDDLVAGFCVYQTIYELGSGCASDSPLKPYQRDAIKQIKTLTCHARPCKDMPDPGTGAPGQQDAMTFPLLTLGAGGTNLDVTYCESEANAGATVDEWMRAL